MNIQVMAKVMIEVSRILLFMLHTGQRRNIGKKKYETKNAINIFNNFSL